MHLISHFSFVFINVISDEAIRSKNKISLLLDIDLVHFIQVTFQNHSSFFGQDVAVGCSNILSHRFLRSWLLLFLDLFRDRRSEVRGRLDFIGRSSLANLADLSAWRVLVVATQAFPVTLDVNQLRFGLWRRRSIARVLIHTLLKLFDCEVNEIVSLTWFHFV